MDKLVLNTITVREMGLPSDVKLSKEALAEWLAMALGLSRTKERRKTASHLLAILIESAKVQQPLTFEEIHLKLRKKEDVDAKTLYYHLNKLQQLGVVKRKGKHYTLGDGFERNAYRVFEETYRKIFERAFERIKEAFDSYYSL